MKKLIIMLGIVLLLTGCTENVNLTEQESDMIAEYASGLLLKHDRNYNQSVLILEEESKAEIETAAEEEKIQEPENKGTAGEEEKQGTGMESAVQGIGSLEPEIKLSIEKLPEILGLDGFHLLYTGYEICDFYPNTSENGAMDLVVNSGADYELMVIKLSIQNISDESKDFNILNSSSSFSIRINDQIDSKMDKTMLLNDFTTFSQAIEPGQSADSVLIGKISNDFDGNVSTIDLSIDTKGISSMVTLQ